MFKRVKRLINTIIVTLLVISTNHMGITQVVGESMYPTLYDGDYLIVDIKAKPEDQDIVIIKAGELDIECELIVKRYYEDLSSENGLYVIGDNMDNSLDSRTFGEIPKEKFYGVVIWNVNASIRDLKDTIIDWYDDLLNTN